MTDSGSEMRDFLWAVRRALRFIIRYIEERYGFPPT